MQNNRTESCESHIHHIQHIHHTYNTQQSATLCIKEKRGKKKLLDKETERQRELVGYRNFINIRFFPMTLWHQYYYHLHHHHHTMHY